MPDGSVPKDSDDHVALSLVQQLPVRIASLEQRAPLVVTLSPVTSGSDLALVHPNNALVPVGVPLSCPPMGQVRESQA